MSATFPGWTDDGLARAHRDLDNARECLSDTLKEIDKSLTALELADDQLAALAKARGEA
jgi:hypothetical protein